VVKREREVENFVPQEYWDITAQLKKIKNSIFEAVLFKKDKEIIPKLGIKTKKQADEIIEDLERKKYKVISIEKKELKKNPLPPFTTSTLQQESWKRFHWPAKSTMRIAQQLYEAGLITYHRTDSLNLSEQSLFSAKEFIIENFGKEYWPGFSRRYKTKAKGAQEAHEAIRPSYPEKTAEKLKIQKKLEQNQVRLYELIWRRFIASQMSQSCFDSTIIEIEAGKYLFKANGQTLKFDGFLKVYPIKFQEIQLPVLEKDEVLELIKLIPAQHFTQPPSRYTEATLIKALEENGIGRPSTYAPIISTIQERNYVEKNQQRKFQPTQIGLVVNDLLVKHFPNIVDIQFTARMEENLDKIAENQKNWVEVLKEFYLPFEENLKQKYEEVTKKEFTEKPTKKKCPQCNAPLVIRLGKFGEFYACSNFPKCKYTQPLKKGLIKCPKCQKGEILEKRTKKGAIFYGCSKWPECDFALWDKPVNEKCLKCQSLLIQTKRGEIKCSNKECDYKRD